MHDQTTQHPGRRAELPKLPVMSQWQWVTCEISQALFLSFLQSCKTKSWTEILGTRPQLHMQKTSNTRTDASGDHCLRSSISKSIESWVHVFMLRIGFDMIHLFHVQLIQRLSWRILHPSTSSLSLHAMVSGTGFLAYCHGHIEKHAGRG